MKHLNAEKEGPRSRGREIDMLHGSLWDKILRFALPLALTGVLQQLFNAADTIVVGRFVGKTAMAAVGSNSPIIGLAVNLFVGIAVGANVVIARYTGQRDPERVSRAVHTSVLFSLIAGVAMGILGQFAASPLLHLLGVPPRVFPMSIQYLRIYFAGLPVILLYNFEAAIFRSQGDTRTPLLCLTTAGVLNVGLNLFFVIVCGMAASGVALATVLSNAVSSALMFALLVRHRGMIRLQPRGLKIDRDILFAIFRIGVPAGLQGSIFAISNLCVQSGVNSLGEDVMAASSAAFNIEIFAFYIINAFGQAATTFIGQNYGAREPDRCRRSLRDALLLDFLFTAVIVVILLAFGKPILSLFNKDPVVVKYGYIRILYILAGEGVNDLEEVLSGALRGFGYSMQPAILTLVGVCGIRIGWIYTYFAAHPSLANLMIVYPMSWAVTAAGLIVTYLVLRKKIYAEIGEV